MGGACSTKGEKKNADRMKARRKETTGKTKM
jgi:hypothetical protein